MTGAAIPKAVVELTDAMTGQKAASAVTAEDGRYRIEKLGPGAYVAKVISPGFKAFVITSLTLRAHETTQLNVTLEIDSAGLMGVVVLVESQPVAKKVAFFFSRPFRKNR
jgi:Carboxypeptidase regulatory-like domain